MNNNSNLSYEHLFTDEVKQAFNDKHGNTKKIYAVMSFNTEMELGISNKPYEWVNSNSIVTADGSTALYLYRKFSNDTITKIVDALSFNDLNKKMIEMTNNFKNPFYVQKVIQKPILCPKGNRRYILNIFHS